MTIKRSLLVVAGVCLVGYFSTRYVEVASKPTACEVAESTLLLRMARKGKLATLGNTLPGVVKDFPFIESCPFAGNREYTYKDLIMSLKKE